MSEIPKLTLLNELIQQVMATKDGSLGAPCHPSSSTLDASGDEDIWQNHSQSITEKDKKVGPCCIIYIHCVKRPVGVLMQQQEVPFWWGLVNLFCMHAVMHFNLRWVGFCFRLLQERKLKGWSKQEAVLNKLVFAGAVELCVEMENIQLMKHLFIE